MSDHDQPETCRECKVMHYDGRGHVCQQPVSDTWTPEQMRAEAGRLEGAAYTLEEYGDARAAEACRKNAAMLRQGAADRERVTALEANLATVDVLRQAAEAAKVELAGRVKWLEANWEALKAWAQTQDAATLHVDDAVNWAYERMRDQMALLEESAFRQAWE